VITAVFDDDGKAQRVISKILKGHVSYMPLRLAYATTVHKCVAYGTKITVQGRGQSLSSLHTLVTGSTPGPGNLHG